MRTCSVQLEARLQVEAPTLARLWRVTRKDGSIMRFTDAVKPITIEVLPDVAPHVYRSDISFTASAIFMSRSAANQQSVTMTFIMSDDGFNESELRRRLYDGAVAEIMIVDYEHLDFGVIHVYKGLFGQVRLSDLPIGEVEVVPAQGTINGIGLGLENYSQTCRASLGDARCKIDIESLKVAFTVGSAIGGSVVASALTQDNKHWDLGFVRWTSGRNIGTTSKVQSNNKASTSLFLAAPPFFAIEVGDQGEVLPGCDKLRFTCLNKFNNVVNIRAEPDVPDGAAVPGSNYTHISGAPLAG